MRTTALNPITSSPESPGEADSLPVWSASAALFADPLSRSLVCFIAGLCSERERQQVKDGDYSRLHSHLLRLLPKAELPGGTPLLVLALYHFSVQSRLESGKAKSKFSNMKHIAAW